MYVIVEFVEALPAHLTPLRQSLVSLAHALLEKRLGCLTFDIGQDEMDSMSFLIYQVYTNKAAYVAHTELPEYAAHRSAADPWTRTRRHLTYELVSRAGNA